MSREKPEGEAEPREEPSLSFPPPPSQRPGREDSGAEQRLKIDVEHLPVNDDPRLWGSSKKNLVRKMSQTRYCFNRLTLNNMSRSWLSLHGRPSLLP
jgi:hypothetical protein